MENLYLFLVPFYLTFLTPLVALAAPPEPQNQNQNLTISLPPGTTNHGNPKLLCTKTQWTDLFTFFFGNYIAHAVTVVTLPGETPISYFYNAVRSLLFPAFGAFRGLRAISIGYVSTKKMFERVRASKFRDLFRMKTWEEHELARARRAGALCMIVRTSDWEPQDGDVIEENVLVVQEGMTAFLGPRRDEGKQETIVTERAIDDPTEVNTQRLLPGSDIELGLVSMSPSGTNQNASQFEAQKPSWIFTYATPWTYCRKDGPEPIGSREVRCAPADLGNGYCIIMVPPCIPVRELLNDTVVERIGSSYGVIKSLIALFQFVFSIKTLYQTRGDQIDRYGYAAFGLTVASYAVMSFVNLLGALSRPEYDAVYLIGSPVMVEERKRKGLSGYYDGVVGEVLPPQTSSKFEDMATISQMQFTQGGARFITIDGSLHVKYKVSSAAVPSRSQEVVSRVWKQSEGDNCDDPRMLFLPGATPYSYNPKNPARTKPLRPIPLPNGPAGDPPILTLNLRRLSSILPRSIRKVEYSRRLSFFISLTSLIPIGLLSHFRTGSSTVAQRVITMGWLAIGSAVGFVIAGHGYGDTLGWRSGMGSSSKWKLFKDWTFYLVMGSIAISGWVVVGQMLLEYGTCVELPGE